MEAGVVRWSWGLGGRSLLDLIVVLLLMWVDGDLWGLWGIGVMLRLLRGLLWIRRLPLYCKGLRVMCGGVECMFQYIKWVIMVDVDVGGCSMVPLTKKFQNS